MDDDTRELLTLIVQAGKVAERMLAKAAEVPEPEAAPEPEPEPAPEPVPPPALVQVPPGFAIGARGFRDSVPSEVRWYSQHAHDQLVDRYGVRPSIAYRTLQHVRRHIQFGGAEYLFTNDNAKVWAVDLFGRVGFVVTDLEAHSIVTFLPSDTDETSPRIRNQPDIRARLEAYRGRLAQQARQRASA